MKVVWSNYLQMAGVMPRKSGLSSGIDYAHEIFRGLFSWKDYAPEIPECSFHKFSLPRKFRGQTAIHSVSVYFDQLCPRILWEAAAIPTAAIPTTAIPTFLNG